MHFKAFYSIVILILSIPFLTPCTGQDEKFIGLWEIQKVVVGSEQMTPVAKWTRINQNGTYESGNGWLQNSSGTWSYDRNSYTFTATASLDIADEYGGFTISYDGNNMHWTRNEEGMEVKVTLSPITELPMSPADYLEGLWELETSSTDDLSNEKIMIRWDRIYVQFNSENRRSTGYWHIHGHKSEIILLPHNQELNPQSWKIEVNAEQLKMIGISDSNRDQTKHYVRKNSF